MRLAARGARDLEDGTSPELRDEDLVAALRRQARRLHLQALVVAVLVTAALVLLPL